MTANSETPTAPTLGVRRLCFSYCRGAAVIRDLDLSVHRGQVLAVLGRSGCGKTTLLRLIAGLERPRSGTIEIEGRSVSDSTGFVPPERRRVGVVFQDLALFPHLSVARNICFGMRRVPRRTRRDRASELLALVGLNGYEDRMPHTLSGGQQQRIAVARALASGPRVVLLDEPFSALDEGLRESVRAELIERLREAGVATVLVTHNRAEAESAADRLLDLDRRSQGECTAGSAGCDRLDSEARVGILVETQSQ
ncbi:MAG: ABC transporter ATP-binding protein [Planctomycetota bacterium]